MPILLRVTVMEHDDTDGDDPFYLTLFEYVTGHDAIPTGSTFYAGHDTYESARDEIVNTLRVSKRD